MLLRRGLSVVLTASLVIPAALPMPAFAQSATSMARAGGDDSLSLIMKAMAAKSPAEAKALLDQAKAKVASERLPADSQAAIDQLIANAIARISTNSGANFQVKAPTSTALDEAISFTVGGATSPNSSQPLTTEQEAVVMKLMNANPDLRDSMREIARGRLSRDSSNLDAIIQANTGHDLQTHDQANASIDQALADADDFVNELRAHHWLHDYSAENRALRAKHDSVSVDQLAAQIIFQSAEKSVAYGMAKKLINGAGLSFVKKFGAVSVEAIGNYIINANLVLRLADLYQLNLSEQEQDVVILMLLPSSKLGVFLGRQSTMMKAVAERMGTVFAKARVSKAPGRLSKAYKTIMASPLMIGILKGEAATADIQGFKAADGVKVPTANPPAGAPPVAAVEAAIVGENAAQVAAQGEQHVVAGAAIGVEARAAGVTAGEAVEAAAAIEKGAATALNWKWQALFMARSMALSFVETEAVGHMAMWWFHHEQSVERNLETEDFRSYLNSADGEGFVKLLITAMNTGENPPNVVDITKTSEPKAHFITNLALSSRVCSDRQLSRYNVLKKQISSLSSLQARRLNDADYRLLRFACDTRLGSGRYNHMAKEFVTFNAIPEWMVANLRVASYENRVRMGEVLMQLQFLGGEPDPSQLQFFNTTVSKILGLTRIEDAAYFRRFYAFIREHGGVVPNASSPTGYSIGATEGEDPYDLSTGYTLFGAPDMPAAPSVTITTAPSLAPAPAPAVATAPVTK